MTEFRKNALYFLLIITKIHDSVTFYALKRLHLLKEM